MRVLDRRNLGGMRLCDHITASTAVVAPMLLCLMAELALGLTWYLSWY